MPQDLNNYLDENYFWHLVAFTSISFPHLLLDTFYARSKNHCFQKVGLFLSCCNGRRHNMNFLTLSKSLWWLSNTYRKFFAVAYEHYYLRSRMEQIFYHFVHLPYNEIRHRLLAFIDNNRNVFEQNVRFFN